MTRRLAFVLAATTLLSGCSTMGGSEDLFGYATPQPGILASAPGLAAAAAPAGSVAVLPLPPAPAQASAVAPRALPAAAALPPVRGGAPIAATVEDGERDRMIASALAPASAHQSLGELDRNADGSMVLPAGRSLEIIDIAPIRNSMATADDLPAGL